MAQPVWVLSVDLKTNTATFESGMASAAKSARGAFTEIKSGGEEMGRETGVSMMEARHGVMLLGEEFGIHVPRAIAGFLASIGPIGEAMEAAFPFLAVAVGLTLIIEGLHKLHEEAEKVTTDQLKFGTAVQNSFNVLDQKILEARIRTDELNKDHLGALALQLKLIDRQSMDDLVHTFGEVAKAADTVFTDIKSHWYTFGIGATGAKHALDEFQGEYESLLARGKDEEAHGLLAGTLAQAKHVLEMQQQAAANKNSTNLPGFDQSGDHAKYTQAYQELHKAGVGYTQNEVKAQQTLVDALTAQVGLEERINTLKKSDDSEAAAHAHKEMATDAKEALEAQQKALREGREFLFAQMVEADRKEVQEVQQTEKEKIDATKEGSAARLAAIDAAIKEEQAHGYEDQSFYRDLLTQRVALVRQMAEEEARAKADAAKEAAANDKKMDELALAAEKQHQALIDSARRVSAQERTQEELHFSDEAYQIQLRDFAREIAALDKGEKDYTNKLKELQDKELQMRREHENEVTAIMDKAEQERNQKILSAETRFNDTIAAGLTQALMGHKSFASMLNSIGNQIVSGMIENAIKSIMANDMTKESDAAAAARKMFLAGSHFPFPVNIVMAPALGAMAFASVMAFQGGTDMVPGIGNGDIVPALLEPGEGVVPKGVMGMLRDMAMSGERPGAANVHVHVKPTYHVQTIDGDGMQAALDKHTDLLEKHFQNTVRKMNR